MTTLDPGPEGWKTVRAAIRGWGPTLRFITIITAATVCMIALTIAV